jgi:hypothetical protein
VLRGIPYLSASVGAPGSVLVVLDERVDRRLVVVAEGPNGHHVRPVYEGGLTFPRGAEAPVCETGGLPVSEP